MTLTGEQIYKAYARARHEGYTVNESIEMTGAPQSEVFRAISLYARSWIEGMPTCLSDDQIVTLIWGKNLIGEDRIQCEKWVNKIKESAKEK